MENISELKLQKPFIHLDRQMGRWMSTYLYYALGVPLNPYYFMMENLCYPDEYFILITRASFYSFVLA